MTDVATIGFRADTGGLRNAERGLNRVEKAGAGVDSSLGRARNSARMLAGALAAVGAAGVFSKIIYDTAQFETALVGVSKTTGLVGRDLDMLADRIDRLSREIPVTTTELLGMAQAAGQMGVTGADNLEKFSLTVAMLGRASDLAGEQAASALARILNVTGENISQVDVLASVIVSLGNNVAATESEIAHMTTRIARATSAFGVSSSEAAALGAALAAVGVEAEAGGTAVGQAFSGITNAVNAGGAELEEFANALGLNADMLATLFANDKAAGFQYFLEQVASLGDSAGLALENAGLGGIRLAQSLIPLGRNIGIYAETQRLANAETKNATALNREFEATLDTLESRWIITKNVVSSIARDMGDNLSPAIKSVLDGFNDFAENTLPEVVRSITNFGGQIGMIMDDINNAIAATSIIIRELIPDAAIYAGGEVVRFMREAFGEMPTNLRAIIQIMGVEFGFLVDYVKAVAIGIGDIFAATFTALVDSAKETGFAIGRALNPFQQVGDFTSDIAAAFSGPMVEANNRVAESFEIIRRARLDSISAILEERDAALASAGEQVDAGKLVEEQIKKIKKAMGETPATTGGGVTTGATGKELERIASALNAIQRAADPAFAALQDYQTGMDTLAEGLLNNIIDDQQFVTLADHLLQVRDAALEAAKGMSWLDNMEGGMDALQSGFRQIHSTMDSGSKEAQKLGQAMQALSVVQGIAAILNQGMGDPYTAIGRMAAMAAAVASLIGSVGFSGQGDTTAADAQATQGTGGVLGDAAAQSESISKGVDITADATSALVGINRAQLMALEAMRAGITGASTQIMRGQDFTSIEQQWGLFRNEMSGALGDSFDFITSMDGLTGWIDDMLGGSRAIINSGIEIAGGRINDLIDNTMVSAFQMVEEKKHFLDDKDTRRLSEALGDEVGGQFALVFGSMVDAVSASAEVLGFTEDQIRSSIAQFRVAATEISLMDLDGEAQQAAISAVFSDIFDSLAVSVVDYVPEFQQAGESYAETLVRIATQTQVAQEAMTQLGSVLMDGLAGQDIVQMSDDLIKAAGGMESFITGFTGFVDKFATDEHKLSVATNAINSAMGQLGLEVPQSEEALWDLMQTLTDPSQLAGLLRLQDSFATMFDMMDSVARERQGLTLQLLRLQGDAEGALAIERANALEGMHESNRALQEQIWALQDLEAAADAAAQSTQALADFQRGIADQLLGILSPAHAELNQLNQAMGAQIAQAQELGIAEEDLVNMRRLHHLQLLEFAAGLEESIASLSDELFGEADSGMNRTVNAVGSGMNKVRDLMISGIAQVNDWLQSSMLSSTSPLTPEQRLAEAESQFFSQVAAAQTDPTQIAGLRGLADQVLSEGSSFHGGSTAEFDDLWMRVREAMQGVAGMSIPDAVDPQRAIQQATESTAMSALQQITLASDMIGQMAALSRVTGENPADIAERLGVPIDRLMGIIGDTSGELVGSLDQQFNELVTGFDMTIDPLLTAQHTQIEATKKMNDDMNVRLDRLEDIMARGVVYQQRTANQTATQNENTRQLIAVERRMAQSAPTQRVQ